MICKSVSEYIQSLRRSELLGHQVAAYQLTPAIEARRRSIPGWLSTPVRRLLSSMGLAHLYSHQTEALEAIRRAEHTTVATRTASGKSLIYNLSLFEELVRDDASKGLYIFPLKALAQDQYRAFQGWSNIEPALKPSAAVYDGDTSAYQRRKLRRSPPNVLMTNPEMVHLSLLSYHFKWQIFFSKLKLVVVDEVHTYRGLLGSHFAQVLRRLLRVCHSYGAEPIFVFTSATIANPGYLTSELSGLRVTTIDEDGAATGARHTVIMDSEDRPATMAIQLLKAAMARELRTIIYTQSRKMAELIAIWVQQRSGRFSDRISVYRAGLLPAERRQIERDLKQGRLLAVVSTSALELGIDIGDLDICILTGYPGSMIASRQRGGRVGRKGQESALILVTGQDALDQYFVSNPQPFFKGQAEAAVINPYNPVVLSPHLECAASEIPLDQNEPWLQNTEAAKTAEQMVQTGLLLKSDRGHCLYARRKRPHLDVDLRSAGTRFRITDGQADIGEIDALRVYHELHPGAIYLHRGQSYMVNKIDSPTKRVHVQSAEVDYYTRARSESDVHIIEIRNEKNISNADIYFGIVEVTDQVTGYEKVLAANGHSLERIDLDLPPIIFRTQSLWFRVPASVSRRIIAKKYDLLGSLHAAEHAAISIMPLLVLADRNDLGGLATPYHEQIEGAVIFIYDGVPGGAGFSMQAFEEPERLISAAASVIRRCECDQGCPACIHSPKCGSGNQPMDKTGALHLLSQLLNDGKRSERRLKLKIPKLAQKSTRVSNVAEPVRYGVFDLETQRSAQEVGGWHMAHRMRVSCGVVYDSGSDTYDVYPEDSMDRLIDHLRRFDLVVGFNSRRFDYRVLSAYSDYDFTQMPTLDLLEAVYNQLGFRLSLDHLAQQTLGINKTGSGLDALRWWKQGRLDQIIEYCRMDVRITRDLYRFAQKNGYLVYRGRNGDRMRVPLRM